MDDCFTLYGSFTSSSSYKPMLFLALARIPHSFRTVNLKTGAQKLPEYLAVNRYGLVPSLRHRGAQLGLRHRNRGVWREPGKRRQEDWRRSRGRLSIGRRQRTWHPHRSGVQAAPRVATCRKPRPPVSDVLEVAGSSGRLLHPDQVVDSDDVDRDPVDVGGERAGSHLRVGAGA